MFRVLLLLAAAAGIAVTAYAAIAREIPSDQGGLDGDTVRSLLVAQDCASGAGCLGRQLPMGSFTPLGISHGAVPGHVASVVIRAGGDIFSVARVQAVLAALAAALLFLIAVRLGGWAAGPIAFIAYFHVLDLGAGIARQAIWSAGFIPLPAVLFLAAALRYRASGRLRDMSAAAAMLSIGFQIHVIFLPLGLLLVLLAALGPPGRRAAALLAGFLAFSATFLLGSYDVLTFVRLDRLGQAGPPAETGPIEPAFIVLLALGGLVASRPWRARATWRDHPAVVLVPVALLWLVFVLVLPESRYLRVLVPGAALLVTLVLLGSLRKLAPAVPPRMRQLATVVVYLAALLWPAHAAPGLRTFDLYLNEAEALSRHLQERHGWGFEDMFRHVRAAPALGDAIMGLAVFASTVPPRGEGPDVAALVARHGRGPSTAPPGWTRLDLDQDRALFVREYAPYLRWDHFEFCWEEEAGCAWTPAELRPYLADIRRLRMVRGLLRSASPMKLEPEPGAPRAALRLRVPVVVPAGAGPRLVDVDPVIFPRRRADAYVINVAGVPYRGEIPGVAVWIESGAQPATGVLTLRWSWDEPPATAMPPPPVIELTPEDLDVVSEIVGRRLRVPAPDAPLLLEPAQRGVAPPPADRAHSIHGDYELEPPPLLLPFWYVLGLVVLMALLVLQQSLALLSPTPRR